MNLNSPILLVEDDKVDQKTTKRAFKALDIPNPLDIADNGVEALKYLREPKTPKPCLILLDLNMPKMNGIEFLQVIKSDALLRRIPVVVLTTSEDDQDIVKSYNLSVSGYMVKPVDHNAFVGVISTIDLYWSVCALPPAISGDQIQPADTE